MCYLCLYEEGLDFRINLFHYYYHYPFELLPVVNIHLLTSAIEDGQRLLFSPLCVCLFANSITEKLLDGFRRNLVGGIRYGPRIMSDFGLGPKSNMAAMAAILKKYLNFYMF